MFALEYDKQGRKNEARELYRTLYEKTLREEYLFEYSKLSFALKKYDDVIDLVEDNREKKLLIKKIKLLEFIFYHFYKKMILIKQKLVYKSY